MRVKLVKREQEVFMANHCTGSKLKTNCLLCGSYYQPSPTIRSKNNLFCYLLINLCWINKCHPELEVWMKNHKPQPEFNSIACAYSALDRVDTMDDFDRRTENLTCIYEKPEMSIIDSNDKQYVIEHGQDIPIVSYELKTGTHDTESCKQKTTLPHCVIPRTTVQTTIQYNVPPASITTIETSNIKITFLLIITCIVPCIAGSIIYVRMQRRSRRLQEEDDDENTEAKLVKEETLN